MTCYILCMAKLTCYWIWCQTRWDRRRTCDFCRRSWPFHEARTRKAHLGHVAGWTAPCPRRRWVSFDRFWHRPDRCWWRVEWPCRRPLRWRRPLRSTASLWPSAKGGGNWQVRLRHIPHRRHLTKSLPTRGSRFGKGHSKGKSTRQGRRRNAGTVANDCRRPAAAILSSDTCAKFVLYVKNKRDFCFCFLNYEYLSIVSTLYEGVASQLSKIHFS